jgi:hypothetical protein
VWHPGKRPKIQRYDLALLGVKRFEHRHQWRLLQRILRVLDDVPWSVEMTAPLLDLDPTDFARQRNSQIYQLDGSWIPELTQTSIEDPLLCPDSHVLEQLADPDGRCFSLALALALLHAGATCFADLPAMPENDTTVLRTWARLGPLGWFATVFDA